MPTSPAVFAASFESIHVFQTKMAEGQAIRHQLSTDQH
jgi:hypothetical protein